MAILSKGRWVNTRKAFITHFRLKKVCIITRLQCLYCSHTGNTTYRKLRVLMVPTLSSLRGPQVVLRATCSAICAANLASWRLLNFCAVLHWSINIVYSPYFISVVLPVWPWFSPVTHRPALLDRRCPPPLIARFMGPTWGPSGAAGPRWAPCWPHELCYLGHLQVYITGIS